MQGPAGTPSHSRSRSSSSTVRMPAALASSTSVSASASASASASDRMVSPVTSVTDGAVERGEEEQKEEKENAIEKERGLRVASTSTSASRISKKTTITTANTSAVRRGSRARTSLTGAVGTYNVDVLADRQRKRKVYSYPVGLGAETEAEAIMGNGDRGRHRGRGRSLSAADAAKAGYVDSRNVSGATLVNDDDEDDVNGLRDGGVKIGDSGADAEKAALRLSKSVDSLQKINARQGMELQRLKGENRQKQGRENGKIVRRQSTRLQHAANSARDAVSMLGKRGREAMESGMDKAQSLGRSGSTRLRDALRTRTGSFVAGSGSATAAAAGNNGAEGVHLAKKARLSSDGKTSGVKETSPVPLMRKKPRVKRWLASGLYTGQERDLNPRLKHSKNKLKSRSGMDRLKESSQAEMANPRKHMPMPMFAGERLLERGRPFSLPFDVFSPLSERQPKPNEWRKTSRNLFVGDALTVWKKARKLEFSKCICTDQDGCDESCQNRFMLYECNDGNCNIGAAHCQNRAFAQLRERYRNGNKYDIGVEVLQTDGKGFGVRANRSFEPGQIIVEYAGEIITQDECERRMKTVYKKNDCYYLMTFHQGMIIDATRGSIARFVNHSCEPNCRMVKWTVEGEPRMALFAGEGGIMTGDELTYDYNFDPFSQKNVQKCLCGAETCRGVLGPKVSERPKVRVEAESQIAGVKRKSRDISRDATSNDEDDGEEKNYRTKKAKMKTKSNKQDQKQKLSAAAKKTTSVIKNAITGETSIAQKKNRDRQSRVERAAMLSTPLSAISRSSVNGRRTSGTSIASAHEKKNNNKKLQILKTNVPGKLQSPFRKLASNVKGHSNSRPSSKSNFAANGNAAIRRNSGKRRSLLQRTTTSAANGSESSLKPLTDDTGEKENSLGRRSIDDGLGKSSATSGARKLNAGMRRLVGKGGLGRRRTVSGARLR